MSVRLSQNLVPDASHTCIGLGFFAEEKHCCSGFCIDLLKKLAEEIGFDFKLYQVQDEKWGSKNEHGEWNGLIKDLVRPGFLRGEDSK